MTTRVPFKIRYHQHTEIPAGSSLAPSCWLVRRALPPQHAGLQSALAPRNAAAPDAATTPNIISYFAQSQAHAIFEARRSTSTSTSRCGGTGASISGLGSTDSAGLQSGCSSSGPSRRQLLLALGQAAGGLAPCSWGDPSAAASAAATVATSPPSGPATPTFLQPLLTSPTPDLLDQLEGREPIFQPGVAWALRNRDRQLFYPSWLAGEWRVTGRFAAASFPQGRRLLGRTVPGVLKGSMAVALPDVGAGLEGPVRFRVRFLESVEEGGVVADRVFNVRQLMDAFYGFEVTRKVEYEPLKNPTRLTLVYATPRRDTSVISEDLRKAELIINNRISKRLSPTDFICGELFRQISQASAQGFVGDYEIIARYSLLTQLGDVTAEPSATAAITTSPEPPATRPETMDATAAATPSGPFEGSAARAGVDDGGGGGTTPRDAAVTAGVGARVRVLQRVASFLQPQDAAFFEAGNQAVAVYDYTYDMVRVA